MSSQSSQAGVHYLLDDLACSIHKITVNIGGLEKRINLTCLFVPFFTQAIKIGNVKDYSIFPRFNLSLVWNIFTEIQPNYPSEQLEETVFLGDRT